jgi:hypothetical protein
MCPAPQKFQTQLKELTELLTDAPTVAKSVILHSYARIAEMYLNASEGRRAGYGIAAVNVGTWVALCSGEFTVILLLGLLVRFDRFG